MTSKPWVPDPLFLDYYPDWPLDPMVFGLLGLDRRGLWQLRGRTIRHEGFTAFLHQHYHADACGRWYVQNGQQQLYIDLAYTPWIFHLHEMGLQTHTHRKVRSLKSVWIDESGMLIVDSEHGPGMLREDALFALLDRLCDHKGRPMRENPLDPGLATSGRPTKPKLHFKWHGRLFPVGWIHSRVVGFKFQFIDRPGAFKMA